MWPNPQETSDLVTFTEKILNGKLYFLCSEENDMIVICYLEEVPRSEMIIAPF